MSIDASDIPAGLLLAALYNNSRPIGMGHFHADAAIMTQEVADTHLENGKTFFDYLNGRPLKIQLKNMADINPHGYDRDNGGQGSLLRLVESMRTRREESSGVFSLPPVEEIQLKTPVELQEEGARCAASMTFSVDQELRDV